MPCVEILAEGVRGGEVTLPDCEEKPFTAGLSDDLYLRVFVIRVGV